MKRIFCIGNGESRKGFDLEQLRQYGRIYGCNALWRDFTPDVLICVDQGIMHEVYQSGYCNEHDAWFRDWTKIPAMMYESMLYGGIEDVNKEELKDYYDKHVENERGDASEFVFHGSQLSGLVGIIKSGKAKGKSKEIIQQQINHSGVYISWIKPGDKSHDLQELIPNYKKDLGWAAGATTGRVAVEVDNPVDEMYLIGHDLYSNNQSVNNMYKGTKHYVPVEHGATPCDNWIIQWKAMFTGYPHIKFYKVNRDGVSGSSPIDTTVQQWIGCKNIEYIDYTTMLDKVKK